MSARVPVSMPQVSSAASAVDALAVGDERPAGEVVRLLSAGDAQRLTQQIKLAASGVRNGLFKLRNLIDEARGSNAWNVLGFSSWTAYLVDALGDEPLRVSREERVQLVGYLAGEGLSTRAIAPIVGVDNKTVHNDLKRIAPGVEISTPESSPNQIPEPGGAQLPEGDEEPQAPDVAAVPTPVEPSPAAPRVGTVTPGSPAAKVTGLDGKQYTRTEPKEPRRRSLVDDAFTANNALWKAIENVRAITRDDRYTRNKADIQAALQPSVDLALEVLTDLVNTRTEN